MGIESAQYVNQLVPTNPLSTDSVSQADDHLRMIKLALTNTFPNLSGPVTASQDQLNSPIPSGTIVLWAGQLNTIPKGYVLCDGTNNTPNLSGNFVMGASASVPPMQVGGSATSGFGGAHTHTENSATDSLTLSSLAVAAGAGSTVISGVTANGHTHTINQVGDHTHSCLPPYTALCYIMKT
ncbi:hypothetical protein [Burkholderia vietnamiensis]|uniref:hypothetical protein n=1 Tax=Burkholderia vietnamiensis TaxID=60552 RepID=UPI002655DC66|nr:hypothetical protein [Burkholderia vietnamiensis]MDN8037456.1 hypothetical protein [Burkholderia vietnamiensis]